MLFFETIHDNYPWELLLDADPAKELVKEYLNNGECWAAKRDGSEEVLGVYVLNFPEEKTAELINLAVKSSHQGRGIGKECVAHAVQRCRELGISRLEVGTGNSGIGQIAFYQKCGFRMTGVIQDFFLGRYEEEVVENGISCKDMVRFAMDLNTIDGRMK